MVVEQAEGRAPEDVGVEPLLSVLILEGLLPVDGGKVEDATCGSTPVASVHRYGALRASARHGVNERISSP
jgi:hypothetical protein